MRKEYDISKLSPRPNPYTRSLNNELKIDLSFEVIDYFKKRSKETGIPYQTLIGLYLEGHVKRNKG